VIKGNIKQMMRSFGFFLKETFEDIRRHSTGSLVTFLQVFISLFFLGMCLLFIINVNHFVGTFLNNLQVLAFLSDDLTLDQVTSLKTDVEGLPGVRKVTYVSKEEAMAIMQEQSSLNISDLVRSNPLPASLKITVDSPGSAKTLAPEIKKINGVNDVRYGEEQLQSLLPFFYGIELVSFFWAIFTAIATLFTIMNTVRLAILARKKEIKIMQLVGATSWFIRLPFLFEGLIYGLGGATLALGLLAIGYRLILNGMANRTVYNPWMLDFHLMMSNLAVMMFILGGLISIVASLIAVGKHLEEDIYRPVQNQQGVIA
jgi:cell division transport system permease protein